MKEGVQKKKALRRRPEPVPTDLGAQEKGDSGTTSPKEPRGGRKNPCPGWAYAGGRLWKKRRRGGRRRGAFRWAVGAGIEDSAETVSEGERTKSNSGGTSTKDS